MGAFTSNENPASPCTDPPDEGNPPSAGPVPARGAPTPSAGVSPDGRAPLSPPDLGNPADGTSSTGPGRDSCCIPAATAPADALRGEVPVDGTLVERACSPGETAGI